MCVCVIEEARVHGRGWRDHWDGSGDSLLSSYLSITLGRVHDDDDGDDVIDVSLGH